MTSRSLLNHLEPMIFGEFEGNTTRLSQEQMSTLAIWMTKTTLAYELLDMVDRQTTLPSDRKWFSEHRRPFPESRIWIVSFEDDLALVAAFSTDSGS